MQTEAEYNRAMIRMWSFISFVAVILLVCHHVGGFDRMDLFMRGPLNPYVHFTDELRCALEQVSDKALKGDLSAEEAKTLLEKWDVRRCIVDKGTVGWTIPYFGIGKSVEYLYSPRKPCPSDEYQPLGNNWYWRKIR